MVLLTVNILLGLMLSTRYSPPLRWWPYGRRRIFDIHNWTAYVALTLVVLHPVFLLFSSTAHFHFIDVAFPVHSPGQTIPNCLGAIAFYLVLLVIVTSYLRKRLGWESWKLLHYTAYVAAGVLFVHGIIIDPNLKKLPPDLLDGEKVLVEVCCLIVLAGSLWRLRIAMARRERLVAAEKVW